MPPIPVSLITLTLLLSCKMRARRMGTGQAGVVNGRAKNHFLPSFAGEVSASYADGGVMRVNDSSSDPSVAV
jgi:hypothetical protein